MYRSSNVDASRFNCYGCFWIGLLNSLTLRACSSEAKVDSYTNIFRTVPNGVIVARVYIPVGATVTAVWHADRVLARRSVLLSRCLNPDAPVVEWAVRALAVDIGPIVPYSSAADGVFNLKNSLRPITGIRVARDFNRGSKAVGELLHAHSVIRIGFHGDKGRVWCWITRLHAIDRHHIHGIIALVKNCELSKL